MNADMPIGLPAAVRVLNDPSVTVSKLLTAIEEGRLPAIDDERRPGRKLVTLADVRQTMEAKAPEPEGTSKVRVKKARLRRKS